MGEGLDNDEVAELYRRYGFFLRRRCRLLLRNHALADDALQETFLKLLGSGAGFRAADHPMRWLYRVVDRVCFDHLRKKRRAGRDAPIDDVADELPEPPSTTPELRRAAVEMLALLGDEERQIAVMAFVDGMTQQEIADELGYSRMTIIKRLAGVREQAERSLRRRPLARTS